MLTQPLPERLSQSLIPSASGGSSASKSRAKFQRQFESRGPEKALTFWSAAVGRRQASKGAVTVRSANSAGWLRTIMQILRHVTGAPSKPLDQLSGQNRDGQPLNAVRGQR